MKIQHILVTTDLSVEAERAFPPVQELAKAQGARVTLLHVVPALTVAPHGIFCAFTHAFCDPYPGQPWCIQPTGSEFFRFTT